MGKRPSWKLLWRWNSRGRFLALRLGLPGSVFAQRVQDADAADREADHCAEGSDQHAVGVEMKQIGDYRGDSERQSHDIQPQGRVYSGIHIFAQTKLQQQGRQANRSDYYER